MATPKEKRQQGAVARLADSPLLFVFVYLAAALPVYVVGFAGNVALPAGSGPFILQTLFGSHVLIWHVAQFVLAIIALHLAPLVLMLASMQAVGPMLRRHGFSRLTYFLFVLLSGWTAVLALNRLHFPNSAFALLMPVDSASALAWLGGVSLFAFAALGVLPALWRLARAGAPGLRRRSVRVALGAALAVGIISPVVSYWAPQPAPARQPDVIVIGLDSVSPLHLQHHPGALPRLEAMLDGSTVFTNTLTPLARTFPAWTSILTAKYPVNSGARFNLTAFEQVDARVTLPRLLQARGYATLYAQDERKFNNIDESFGFDAAVGPRPGAAEFVLTQVADQPLVNLMLLAPWADELFPFVALNRAAAVQYDPDAFVDAIADALPTDRSRPLFLATHFCLAHHPYTWRNRSAQVDGVPLSLEDLHMEALGALEVQIDRLLHALKRAGRLDNAILVLVSDHGESLGYRDGRWVKVTQGAASRGEAFIIDGYPAFVAEGGLSGHGSDVLDRTQYQTLLAFRGFGPQQRSFPAGKQGRIASLVDVMPTLAGALGLAVPGRLDGVNLLNTQTMRRVVPTETGIRFDALSSIANIDENALLAESKAYYEVDVDSARLVVRAERYPELVASKDIAFHTDEWMLALLRKDASPVFPRVALLVHKPTGTWTLGSNKGMLAKAPVGAMRDAATKLYGDEIADFAGTWAFRQR
jgi:arylsulfatase A-like enzyme